MVKKSIHSILLFCGMLAAAFFVRPQVAEGQCIDFYDLNDDTHVLCEYGLYSAIDGSTEWSSRVGGVNYGMYEASSRHTIHNVTGRYDERTLNSRDYQNHPVPNGLLEVPIGEQKSVRLGNWIDGNANGSLTGEAERITYTYQVTPEAPYLQIKYAVIWESPNHLEIPPRFSIEFLHEDNTPAPVNCGEVDINVTDAANMNSTVWTSVNKIWEAEYQCYRYEWVVRNGRWVQECVDWLGAWINDVGDHDVYWQDWKTVGVSLESYIGQTIKIRITSADCGYTAHFGYSYFTIRCIESNPFNPTCGDENSTNTFIAPNGFDYAWYKCYSDSTRMSTDPIATTQSIEVPSNRQLYECEVQTPGNALCAFRLYVKSEPRLPKSDFSIEHRQNCIDTLFLTDLSCVSPDHIICYSPHRNVDSVIWNLGDGRVTKENLTGVPIVYANPGTYTITQTAKLSNGNCVDVSTQQVVIRGGTSQDHTAELHREICAGDFVMFDQVPRTTSGTYVQHTPTAIGCDSITTLYLTVRDTFFRADTIDLLQGKFTSYMFHKNGLDWPLYPSGAGRHVYWDQCKNIYNCDSTYKLVLDVHPKYLFEVYDTICSGTYKTFGRKSYYFKVSQTAKDTICYDSLLTTRWGNDSVYRLYLHVKPTYHYYETKHFCARKSYAYHGQTFTESGNYDVHFSTRKGCDSIYHLTLIEDESPIVDTAAVITDKQKPYVWHGILCPGSGTYKDTLKTKCCDCDSVVRLKLTIIPTSFTDDGIITLCKDSTRRWHTQTLSGSTVGTFVVWDSLKNVYGGDSVYKATLIVNPSYRTSYSVTQPIGSHYYGFYGQDITTGGTYTYNDKTKCCNCDSIVTLNIAFKPTYLIKDTAYICEGKSYKYHKNHTDVYYTKDSIYWDSLKTVAGYDSVYQLRLYVNPVYTTPISATICQPASYDFFGTPLFSSKDTTKILKTHGRGGCECDSTIVLNLTVNPKYDITLKDTICEGKSVIFEGETKTESGYFVSPVYPSKDGCDSINRLQLTVLPKIRVHHSIHLCEGESWEWKRKGEYISTNREVSDTLASASNCDSIDFWHIYVHPVTRDTLRDTICQGKTYTFHGHSYKMTKTGNDTITLGGNTSYGCDSTHVLILTVNPTYYEQPIDTSLCLGDYITIHSKTYSRGGTYRDTIPTENGCNCDSAFIIHIEEHPRFFRSDTVALCKDSVLLWHNKIEIKKSGTYYDSLKSHLSNGACDSVYELVVREQEPAMNYIEATIWSTQSYSFGGKALKESGVYLDTLHSGCGVITELTLTVLPVYNVHIIDSICRGQEYPFNGKQLDTTGLYTARLISKVYGTDSIVNLTLVVWDPRIKDSIVHISDKQLPYHWTRPSTGEDLVFTGGTLYEDKLTSNVTGCDSIIRFKLNVHPTYDYYDTARICAGKSYAWHGGSYSVAQDYIAEYKTDIWQYDSIHHLHLIVNPTYENDTTFHLCTGETVRFGSRDFGIGDDDQVRFFTKCCSCDSIYKVHIIGHSPFLHTDYMTLCKDSTATWRKYPTIKATKDTIYYDSLKSQLPAQCDSVYKLEVTVKQPGHSVQYATIWSNSYYWFHGQELNVEDTYFDTIPAAPGSGRCDSIVELRLTVLPVYNVDEQDTICRGDTLHFYGQELTNPGPYSATVPSQLGTDSTIHLFLVVHEPRLKEKAVSICDVDTPYIWHRYSKDTDVKLYAGGVYDDTIQSLATGCDSINRLKLTINPTYRYYDTVSICQGQSYAWHGNTYRDTETHDYEARYTTNNCDSVHYLHLIVNPTYKKDTILHLCTGETAQIGSKQFHAGDNDSVRFFTAGCRCDSVYYVEAKEYSPFLHTDYMTLCKDSTATWRYKTIKATKDTIYYDSLKSNLPGKCDSVYMLRVTVRNPEYSVKLVTILSTSYYYFNGQLLNKDSIYFDTVPAVNNTCDSIIELRLTVLPVYKVDTQMVMCRGSYYVFKDTTIETSGLYTRTFTSKYGTDSVVNLTMTVLAPEIVPVPSQPVHISDKQLPYIWHRESDDKDSLLTATGLYDDILKSNVKPYCDSINRLQLFVHKTYLFNQVGETCKGKTFRWRENDYPAPNVGTFDYYDSLKTNDIWQFDSVYHLTLIVNPTYSHDTTVYLCEGDFYDLNGTHLTEGGYHYDTLKTTTSNPEIQCDSTFCVFVNIRTTRISPETQYICPGGEYSWRGKVYNKGGEYDDTLKTKDTKCDSIYYHLTLREKTKYETDVDDEICSNQLPYYFHGRRLYKTGVYDTTLKANSTLCDSIVHLHLTVNQAYDTIWYDTICRGVSKLFDNVLRSESGIYVYHGTTRAGCDSIVELRLTVIEKQNTYFEKHLCEGDYFEINGEKITESGPYTETATSQYGCDSTTTWRVTIEKPMRDTTYAAICKGKKYPFHGVNYDKEGTYVHEDKSRWGCDSTYVLVLKVNPVYSNDTALTLCENDYFTYDGKIHRDGGYFSDTARTRGGCNCDSILNITITKHPITKIDTTARICRGERLSWHGHTYSRAGFYFDTLQMKSGLCDSIVYGLRLIVSNDFYEEQNVSICDNNYFAFRGRTYNESGIYYDSLTTAMTGCDSIYCLKLTVNPTYRFVTSENRCDIEPYWWNGHWLVETGDYVESLTTNCGCDSINTLHLVVTTTKRDTVNLNICNGGSITYLGRTITETGTYRDTVNLPDIHQCLVSLLEVGFYTPTIISNVIVDNICADDEQFHMRAYYSGNRPTSYSLLFDDHARAEGFKNILNQPFEDVISGPIPQFDGSDYVRPDYYKAMLAVDNDICNTTDRAYYEVQLLVRYPSWIIEQNWNDVVALLNENFNGGYQFSKYEWIVNNNQTGNHLSYLYLPTSLGSGDEVAIMLTRQGENYAVPSCPITIYDKTPELVSDYPVLAHPTEVRGQIRIVAQTDGEYSLYTSSGSLITTGKYHSGEQLLVQTHVAEGCYLLRLSTSTHGVQTKKIILR